MNNVLLKKKEKIIKKNKMKCGKEIINERMFFKIMSKSNKNKFFVLNEIRRKYQNIFFEYF